MNYSIIESPSGTSEKEIRKAKRIFQKMLNQGQIQYSVLISDLVQIKFIVSAEFYNEIGEKIGICEIN